MHHEPVTEQRFDVPVVARGERMALDVKADQARALSNRADPRRRSGSALGRRRRRCIRCPDEPASRTGAGRDSGLLQRRTSERVVFGHATGPGPGIRGLSPRPRTERAPCKRSRRSTPLPARRSSQLQSSGPSTSGGWLDSRDRVTFPNAGPAGPQDRVVTLGSGDYARRDGLRRR